MNYLLLLKTGIEGHEAKYNQMRYGYQKGEGYYEGPYQTTPLRGTHPKLDRKCALITEIRRLGTKLRRPRAISIQIM